MNAITVSNDIHLNMLNGTIPEDTFIQVSDLPDELVSLTCKKTKCGTSNQHQSHESNKRTNFSGHGCQR